MKLKKMKLHSIITLIIIVLLSVYFFCKPKTPKQKLYGSWCGMLSDARYEPKAFQLIFYRNDTFYWYLEGRAPESWARGKFTLTDTTKISFIFSDTNEESVFIIKKIEPKLIEVDYDGHIILFERTLAIKTFP